MSAKPTNAALGRIRRLLPHLRPARWDILGGLLAGVVYSISSGVGLPLMFKTTMPIFFGKAEEASPFVVKWSQYFFGDQYAGKLLITACLGLPLIFAIRGAAAFANRYLITRGGYRILESLRMEVFDRLQQLPLAFYHRHKSGDLQARLMSDTQGLNNVITQVSTEIVKQPLTLLFSIGTLLYLAITERSALFALVALISVPLCVLPIRMAAKRIKKRARQLAEHNGELVSITNETLQSPAEIQAYNLQAQQRTRFNLLTREIFRLGIKAVKYDAVTSPLIEFISVVGFAVALYVSVGNGMTFGTFSALGLALYLCYEPIKKLSSLNAALKNGEVSLERLEAVLHATDTVPDPIKPVALPAAAPSLHFERVGFAYDTTDQSSQRQAALRDITLTISPGETVALVGPSGAGKSTFAAMIPRFYDPTAGTITFNQVDLRTVTKKELRDRIALVSQTPVLFNATLADNIRAGRLGASDAEVLAAAEKAHLGTFIATLPLGLQTPMGERGSSLSGGQRQRVAIARAFLKDAPILILDEATSALDSESEASIQAALQELAKGRTTLMIAHRFSSIRHATRILVFEDGRIVADGPHAELYATSPLYRNLYDQQAPTRSS
jgi:subfamily B ATP-binding cassette protein MsbA